MYFDIFCPSTVPFYGYSGGSSNYPHLFGFRCQVSHRSHVQSGFVLHGPCCGFLDKYLGWTRLCFSCSQMARSEMQLVCWMVSWNLDFTRAMCLEESVGFVCECETWWLGLREIIQVKGNFGDREGEQQTLAWHYWKPPRPVDMNATWEDLEIWSPKVSGT